MAMSPKTEVRVYLEPELLQRIDQATDELSVSRSQFMRDAAKTKLEVGE